MKTYLTLFFLLTGLFAFAQTDLFLIAGQSNARGRGTAALSPETGPYAREYRYGSDQLVQVADPVGENVFQFQSANTGSFLPAFANACHESTGRDVVLIHCTRGGTPILPAADLYNNGNWSETGVHFGNALTKTNAAIAKTGAPLRGILWCQGEMEGLAMPGGTVTADQYKDALVDLIARFRAEYPGVPFYIIETGRHATNFLYDDAFAEIRSKQQEVADEDPLTYIAYDETKNFIALGWMAGDGIHYTQAGYNDIGTVAGAFVAALTTSVEDLRAAGIRFFPNPFVDALHLRADNLPAEQWLTLYNAAGERILERQFLDTLDLDLSHLPPGVYWLRVRGVGAVKVLKQQ